MAEDECSEHEHHDESRSRNHACGCGEAVGHCRCIVAGSVVFLFNARQQKHFVVHRQTKDNGEQHHWGPTFNWAFLANANQVHAPTPLEDGNNDAVCGTDGKQVHNHCLKRNQHASEHCHQQQKRKRQHSDEEQRHAPANAIGEVDTCSREAANFGLDARRWDEVVSQRANEVGSCLILRRGCWVCNDQRKAAILRGGNALGEGDAGHSIDPIDKASKRIGVCRSFALNRDEERTVETWAETFGEHVVGPANRGICWRIAVVAEAKTD